MQERQKCFCVVEEVHVEEREARGALECVEQEQRLPCVDRLAGKDNIMVMVSKGCSPAEEQSKRSVARRWIAGVVKRRPKDVWTREAPEPP